MDEREADLAVAADAEASGRPDIAAQLRAKHAPPDYYNGDVVQLIGKTLRTVAQIGRESIVFEAVTGEKWEMAYEPDCCAQCEIEDVVGDLQDLVGAPIMMAEASTNSNDPKQQNYPDDSFTWTFYKFATAKGYVTIRWYGSSNGYYSETASFRPVRP